MKPWSDVPALRELVESISCGNVESRLPLSVVVSVGDKSYTTARLGDREGLGADLVAAATNQLLVRRGLARVLHLWLRLSEPSEPAREALLTGVVRGCRAMGVALGAVQCDVAGGDRDDLCGYVQGEPLAAPEPLPIGAGDRLVGFIDIGFGLHGHRWAWERLAQLDPGSDDPRSTSRSAWNDFLAARQKSFVGVLNRPIEAGWLRALIAVDADGLVASVRRALPATVEPRWAFPTDKGTAWQQLGWEDALQRSSAGYGLIAVVAPDHYDELIAWRAAWNEPAQLIGECVKRVTAAAT